MTVKELVEEFVRFAPLLKEDSEVVVIGLDKEWGTKTFSIQGLACDGGTVAIVLWGHAE